jgi:energy-coupling factor transporter ATP-binding protein EcfA2
VTARLISIELEAFRGFADARRFDLDADVVLVHGDNGSGKTSLLDGLLWVLTGEIPRLSERARGLRRGHDPIVNVYAGGTKARVRISLVGMDGRTLDFERCGTSTKHELSAWAGDESLPSASEQLAYAFGESSFARLSEAVKRWGILQQHAIGAALDSGATMHERLSATVGLGRITRFAESAAHTAKDLDRECKRLQRVHADLAQRHQAAQALLAAARSALVDPQTARAQLAAAVEEVRKTLPVGVVLQGALATPEDLVAVDRSVSALIDLATSLAGRQADGLAAESAVGSTVAAAERNLADLMRRSEEAVQQAPLQVQLASAAVELLGGACPVCGQAIDEEQVRSHLTELLGRSRQAIETAAATRRAVQRAQARAQEALAAERRRSETIAARKHAAERLREGLRDAAVVSIQDDWALPANARELAAALESLRKRIRDISAHVQRDQPGQIERLSADTSSLFDAVARAQREIDGAEARLERARALDKAAKQAVERVVRRAIAKLGPSFAEVFDRLAPHPAFTELRATQDIYYSKNQIVPQVVDADQQLTANPVLLFSEGQLNVVALSYFLSLALNAREGALPFLVLDDPLQAMDALGVWDFVEVCRRVREHRQLILSTHDRRYASLLRRKLAPREADTRTLSYEFEGWTRRGPRVNTTIEPLAEIQPLLLRRRAS